MANVASVTSNFFPTAQEGFNTTTSGIVLSGATTVPVQSLAGYSDGDTVALVIDPNISNKKQVFTGIVDTAGLQITSVKWTEGTNQDHSLGATVVDYETATAWALYAKGIQQRHNANGTHKTFNETAIIPTAAVQDKAIIPIKSYNPYTFSAYASSGTPGYMTTANVYYKLPFNTERYDPNSNYDTSTYIYTVPVNGYYYFYASAVVQPYANNQLYMGIFKGSTMQSIHTIHTATAGLNLSIATSAMFQCAAGDQISVQTASSQNSTGFGGNAAGTDTYFIGNLISVI